jgi:hypothetical protein
MDLLIACLLKTTDLFALVKVVLLGGVVMRLCASRRPKMEQKRLAKYTRNPAAV